MDLEKLSFLTKNLLKSRSSEQPELDPSQIYNPITWTSGDVINAENLNNYEQTLYTYASTLLGIMQGFEYINQDLQKTKGDFETALDHLSENIPGVSTNDEGTFLMFKVTEETPVHFILSATTDKEVSDVSEELTFKLDNFPSQIEGFLPDTLQVTFVATREGEYNDIKLYEPCGNINYDIRTLNKSQETGIYTGNINDSSTIGNVMSFDPSTGIFTTDLQPSSYENDYSISHIILTANMSNYVVKKNLEGENLFTSFSYFWITDNNIELKIICSKFENDLGMSQRNNMPPFYSNYLTYLKNGGSNYRYKLIKNPES